MITRRKSIRLLPLAGTIVSVTTLAMINVGLGGSGAPAVSAGNPTPVPEYNQGDVNCSRLSGQTGGLDAVDALAVLTYAAGLPALPQKEPCPDIGSGSGGAFGDVDCSTSVNAIDALKILRGAAQLPVSQTQPCTPMGLWPATGT